jgi:hypothetical protein
MAPAFCAGASRPYFDLQPQDGAQVSLALVQAQDSQAQLVQPQLPVWRFSTFVMVISWV